jgi:hypothetical protein
MAILTVSGPPASRFEEAAHAAAQVLRFELVTEARLEQWLAEEFGERPVPPRAWRHAAVSVLARMAAAHHLVIALDGAAQLFPPLPMLLRAGVAASLTRRIGNLMLERRLERDAAARELAQLDRACTQLRRARFGQAAAPPLEAYDLILNAETMDSAELAEILRAAVCVRRLPDLGLLPAAEEARLQFEARLRLARYKMAPAGRADLKKPTFSHASEELFANLLDFYRIQWIYEPRSFPLQWDKDGNVTEAFTPDFYLPEFDLYVELTTMKQSLVTRKNRKVKLLRAIYPHVNIQVFYQRDYQDLVFKYGLRASEARGEA